MRTLNNTRITIPGGYKWWSAETKKWVPPSGTMPNYMDFIFECKRHCIANHLPIGSNWEEQIQDQLCATLDGDWCGEGGHPLPINRAGLGFTLATVLQGTRTLASWLLKAGGKKVELAEAERRASICVTCPFNQAPLDCTSCSMAALREAAISVVGGAETVYHSQLKSCRVCGCSLQAKVHLPLKTLKDNLSESQMSALPKHCWLLE